MNRLPNVLKKLSDKKSLSAAMLHEAVLERAEEELKILRDDFATALAFSKRNYKNSGALPLYIIIGEAGFGKTTLLANSGVNLQTIYGNKVQDEFSTKYCTWLFSLQAIFLDTAGIYTKSDKENPHSNLVWLGFLQLLCGHFGVNPISGVIVVIDAPTLAGSPAALHKVLEDVKERLYEMAHYVEKLPVFLIFTKTDLLPGFSDFFADLSLEDRQQLYGISFVDDDGRPADPQNNFPNAFSQLVSVLQSRLVGRMRQEDDLAKRVNIQHFFLQFSELRSSIAKVINELPYGGHIELQGLYFVSSLQSGVSTDYLMNKLLQAMQIPVAAGGDREKETESNNEHVNTDFYSDTQRKIPIKNSKNYFINDFFKKELLLKRQSLPQKNRRNWGQVVLVSVALLLLITISSLWYRGYSKNIAVFNNVAKIVQHANLSRHSSEDNIAQLEQAIAYLDEQLTFGGVYFGLNQVEKLAAAISKKYYQEVAPGFVPLLQKTLEEELTGADVTEYQYLYATLKAYLMLSDPHKLDASFVQKWFGRYWREKIAINQAVEQHLVLRLKIILQQGLSITPAAQIVATAREILNSRNIPKEDFVYEKLENLYKRQQLHFKFADKEISISKLYIGDNFDRVYQKEIPKLAYDLSHSGGDWVLSAKGDGVAAASDPVVEAEQVIIAHGELEKLVSSLRTLYIKRYVQAWDEAAAEIAIPRLHSTKEVEHFLKEVSNGDYSLLSFIKIAQLNLNIRSASAEFTQILSASRLADWNRVDLKNIYAALNNLANYFSQVTDDQAAFKAAVLRFQVGESASNSDAIATLRALAAQQPQLIKNWLRGIADTSWRALLSGARSHIKSRWESELIPEYKRLIDNNYPFFKEAPSSISIKDFTKFFASNGVMDKFFNVYLRPFADTEQVYWTWKVFDGDKLGFEQDKLEIFIRAALIRKMLYSNNSAAPEVKFSLTMQALTPETKRVILRIGDQTASYVNAKGEKLSNTFVWPGDNPTLVNIAFINKQGKTFSSTMPQDPWAWFKLLDRTNFRIVDKTQRFGFTIDLNGNAVQYELYTEQPINPFIPDIINNFRCPEKL